MTVVVIDHNHWTDAERKKKGNVLDLGTHRTRLPFGHVEISINPQKSDLIAMAREEAVIIFISLVKDNIGADLSFCIIYIMYKSSLRFKNTNLTL
jgi:hypothetical protein